MHTFPVLVFEQSYYIQDVANYVIQLPYLSLSNGTYSSC